MIKTLLFCFYPCSVYFITRFVVSFLLFYILFLCPVLWIRVFFYALLRRARKKAVSITSDGNGFFLFERNSGIIEKCDVCGLSAGYIHFIDLCKCKIGNITQTNLTCS